MLRPDELPDALARAADHARPSEPPVEELLHRARRRYRRKHAALPALAAACAVAVGVVVPITVAGQEPTPPPPADVPVEPAADPRVPDEGDRVRATGLLQLLDGGRARLCVETAATFLPSDGTRCHAGVDLVGLGGSATDGERTTVEGVLRSGAVDVDVQRPEPRPAGDGPDTGPDIPCPAPPGGWPDGNVPYQDTGPDYAGWRDFMARHADLMERTLQLTTADGRGQVMTFLARDEAEREQITGELVALFGADRVCSVISQLDPDEARRTSEAFVDLLLRSDDSQQLYSAGVRYTDGLTRAVVDVAMYAVTPELVDLEQQFPPGAVELHPFLAVVQ